MEKKYNLQERLIAFACRAIDITEALPKTVAGHHLGNQLIRSGTSPALHYGRAQTAESPADFIHKMKVCLKELRETYNCLQIIERKGGSQKRKWLPFSMKITNSSPSALPYRNSPDQSTKEQAQIFVRLHFLFSSVPLFFMPVP
ncbi:MAG: four helix bundle protein [Bacteroidota bacterium]|nr:four helix bundle protein [Bacteroidota bacterium]